MQLQEAASSSGSGMGLPPGFRFHPTDEELVGYYLSRKISHAAFAVKAIVEVDLNKCEPWDLPEKAKVGEKDWYCFSLRDLKYPTGMRINRATEHGYWKATGKDRDVTDSRSRALVGMKKTLVFYRGRAPKGEKTNWIMHEYRLESEPYTNPNSHHQALRGSKQDEWVVCRIFEKSGAGSKKSSFAYADHSHGLNHHRPLMKDSPNPTASDEGDCDTCTATESCYNCGQDGPAQEISGGASELRAWAMRAKQHAAMGLDMPHLLKYPATTYYDPSPRFGTGLPQDMMHAGMVTTMRSSFAHDDIIRAHHRPKMERYNMCEGEDEAQSSQRVGTSMDYGPWAAHGGENVLYEDIPCEGPMAGTDQSSCITESFNEEQQAAGLFHRALRGYNGGLPEMPNPVDALQECMWAY